MSMLAISQVLRLRVLLVAGLIAVTSFSTASAASNFTTIDVTGAGTGAQQGTAIVGIDAAGDVAGIWLDSSGLSHGFVRSASGTITKFDVTSGGSCVAATKGTIPTGMDTAGNIVGMYRDANGVSHGFVRAFSTGTINCYDVTSAQFTKPFGINASTGIVGYYFDANYVFHGFLRATNGTITNPLNAPDAGASGFPEGTQAFSINDSGEIAGIYYDSSSVPHGFVRSASGTFTEFSAPGGGHFTNNATDQILGISVMGIDAAGDVAGSYYDTNLAQHGFLRAANGTFTTLNAPGAGASPCPQYGTGSRLCGTFAVVLDATGDITGGYADSNGIAHGFVRPAETGIISSFDDPSAGSTGSMQGTLGSSLISNASGITIVGAYADTNSVLHGFIYTPALTATTTTLTSVPTPNPSIFGEPVTLSATVTSTAGAPPNGEIITFKSGTISLGTGTLSSGMASLTTTALLGGTDSITSAYGGDADFAGSTSTAVSQVVGKASSSTTLKSSLNPSTYGQSVTLTASVSGQFGGTVTGTVTFSNGSTSLGSVSLSGNSAGLTTTALPSGTDSITAVYGGDTNFTGSTSNTVSQVVNTALNPAPIISSTSPAFASAGGAAFTLTVTGTGFTANSTVYWGTSALVTTFGSATQLTAQVPATDVTTAGTTTAITVVTPTPGGGTSNSFQFEVNSASGSTTGPTFNSTTATVTAGSPASYPVTIPSTVESATVTCLNLPTGASCSYSATTNTLTITTTSATPKGTYQITVVFTETVSGAATGWILLPILLLPLIYMRKKLEARGAWVTACLGLVLLAGAAFSVIGCGGGGGSSSPQTHQVVSSGSVSLTIQ
jgi:hypothetical protein